MSKLNVVIGGGTGLIGKALVSKLRTKDMNVRIITRNPKCAEDLSWESVESCGLPEDTDVVINLAGRNIGEVAPQLLIPSMREAFLREICSSRVRSTQILIRNLPKNAVKFINASAIGFYKSSLSHSYTEEDPCVDYSFIPRLVHEWEASLSGPQLEDVQCALVRTGSGSTFFDKQRLPCTSGVVLSKDGGFLSKLHFPHRVGLGGPIGSGRQWISWIHINDLVNLYCFLITDPVGASQYFLYSCQRLIGAVNGTAPNPVRQSDFSIALSQSLGAPSFGGRFPMPALLIRAVLGAERAPLLLEGQRVLPTRAQSAGFEFEFPTLETALENIYGKRPLSVSTK